LDPIERKPFLHVLPGTNSLSIATAGCNFDCKFCQNWEIALAFPEEVYSYEIPPETVVKRAKQMRAQSVAYSYVEPTIFYEYMLEIGQLARQTGLLNVIHTNGFINEDPLRNLCKVLDAAQVDLKGFTESFYDDLCSGQLAPVLETLKTIKEEGIHLEITNLVIPTKNDDMSLIRDMCLWMKAQAEALSCGLGYVYIGNVPGHKGWNTFCPRCKNLIIQRAGYMIGEVRIKGGKCGYCGKPIPGIWA
jgi:pyruvate formate lyase activating enzyme